MKEVTKRIYVYGNEETLTIRINVSERIYTEDEMDFEDIDSIETHEYSKEAMSRAKAFFKNEWFKDVHYIVVHHDSPSNKHFRELTKDIIPRDHLGAWSVNSGGGGVTFFPTPSGFTKLNEMRTFGQFVDRLEWLNQQGIEYPEWKKQKL
ncbi:hypothetical protein P9D43_29160 [Neobacillus niacini]|uniref:hypothetical protein n=1 Tax=Neobacillus niacini TaxID=86668 RepID=UPI0007ABF866|nr:hypothetical protein [Neobacillus niacini]MEC1526065.1 hypothetical protein [Neobacillus niacini]